MPGINNLLDNKIFIYCNGEWKINSLNPMEIIQTQNNRLGYPVSGTARAASLGPRDVSGGFFIGREMHPLPKPKTFRIDIKLEIIKLLTEYLDKNDR